MRRSKILVAASTLMLPACGDFTTAPTLTSQAARSPSTSVNVTTTVHDNDTLGNSLLTRSDDRSGAGRASYSAASAGVSSVIGSTGAWQLYLGSQKVRTLYLVLGSQGIAVPDGYYFNSVEAFSRCYAADNTTELSFLSMTASQQYTNCSFGVDFKYGQTKYKLAMGPRFSPSGHAVVTCTRALNGGCLSWTIRPSANDADAANLYTYSNNGSLVFRGVYRNTYSIAIDR